MPTIGEQLRLAREKQGRTLSELATATCISSRYLAAIEGDDRKSLPGDFFYRNFVKQYSGALGLDAKPLLTELDSILPREDADVLPVLSGAYVPAGKISKPNRARVVMAVVLLLGAIAGGSGLYAWWEKSQRRDPEPTVAEKKSEAPAKPAAVQPAPEPATPSANPTETAVVPATAPQQAATDTVNAPPVAPAAGGPGVVKLAATEKTWVSVSTNGKTLFSGVLEPAETRSFEGVENGKLVTGNAAGIDVEWNGKAIGPIGPRGQVRTVLLTGESFQIVASSSPRRM
jgi:cytoskeleton protein RodZ